MQMMRRSCIDRCGDKNRFSGNGNANAFERDHPRDQPNAVSGDQGGKVGCQSLMLEAPRVE